MTKSELIDALAAQRTDLTKARAELQELEALLVAREEEIVRRAGIGRQTALRVVPGGEP